MSNIFKSRHKRLVNKIYPKYPHEGLRRDKLMKMLLYAHKRQENYIQVLVYLVVKLGKYVATDQEAYIKITLEAMNSLMFGWIENKIRH